ncbi:MAG TPA: VOC family protein [Blastocatellia bacterium]
MNSQTRPAAGDFCWFELGASDQNAAKEFYVKLFGWQFDDSPLPPEMGGVYTTLTKDGKKVGAMYQLGPHTGDVPPHWMLYVAVESADEAVAKASELGAQTLCQPFDVMEHGRMAFFNDPTGATISVWQAKAHPGAELVNAPGSACWGELATTDVKTAGAFYSSLFGWSLKESADGMPYVEFSNQGKAIGGMRPLDDAQDQGAASRWSVYFAVEDCDATAKKAEELGATLRVPPTDIPNIGCFAVIRDPQGAFFSIFTGPLSA